MITANSSASFLNWQLTYAQRGIATFPVGDDKKPMVKRYDRFGLPGSAEIASKFPDAPAIGFMCGRRSGITVLDIDCKDERVLADALDRHGKTGIVVRSGSGNFQAWYRHNGECRKIRPWVGRPIDVLGGGFVVAPPSRVAKGQYQFIQGGLHDLDRLPVMEGIIPAAAPEIVPTALADWGCMRDGDGRNDALFRLLGRAARHVDDFDQLLDYARTRNDEFGEPMDDARVLSTAKSVWKMTCEGNNWFGKPGVHLFSEDALPLIDNDPDLLRLLMFVRALNRPGRTFMLTNSFCERWGWSRQRLAAVRRRGLERGFFYRISPAYSGHAALYAWNSKALREGEAEEKRTSLRIGVRLADTSF